MSICFSVLEGVISLTVLLEALPLLAHSSCLGSLAAAQLDRCVAETPSLLGSTSCGVTPGALLGALKQELWVGIMFEGEAHP